jgi:chorismate mutase
VKKRPYIISGPCSAETEEQLLNTAKQLVKYSSIDCLRAGIWKPRTRPNSFEGVGETGLQWLKEAGNAVNLPVTTEVANTKHVELALKNNIDILWIGARTVANPFSVQEIANALKGVDIPVMVKNPVNPDLQLWIGAIERILQAGIDNIKAIHRGFSSFEKSAYRNTPKWEIPIELMRVFPEIPIICDPSHIGGNRKMIKTIAQKALDLEMDGLMIESHVNPDEAWSDSKQQITPKNLQQILSKLVVREPKVNNTTLKNKLTILRKKIDGLDEEIINLLSTRMNTVEEIGNHKKNNDITILQADRWKKIINDRKKIAREAGVSEEFIQRILNIIHEESINIQTNILNSEKNE